MKTNTISAFMLERYKLGELSLEDHRAVNEAMTTDKELRSRLKSLEESDGELRLRYPAAFFNLGSAGLGRVRLQFPQAHFARAKAAVGMAGIAAVIVAGILIPVFNFIFSKSNVIVQNELETNDGIAIASALPTAPPDLQIDRPKGLLPTGPELSLYLKGDWETVLSNQAVLEEGNTVQLAYTVPAGSEHYGVIFSIDGRSVVTMHYPYQKGQSPLLVSGRQTFLNEAYTLDDAPDYEVFVMVVSDDPLDVDTILYEAQGITGKAETVADTSRAVFEDCEVQTVTVLKKASN